MKFYQLYTLVLRFPIYSAPPLNRSFNISIEDYFHKGNKLTVNENYCVRTSFSHFVFLHLTSIFFSLFKAISWPWNVRLCFIAWLINTFTFLLHFTFLFQLTLTKCILSIHENNKNSISFSVVLTCKVYILIKTISMKYFDENYLIFPKGYIYISNLVLQHIIHTYIA